MPALRLDGQRVRESLERDRGLLGELPRDRRAQEVRRLVRDYGLWEVEGRRLRQPLPTLGVDVRALSPHDRDALRAEAADELGQALAGDLDIAEARLWLGDFPITLRRYGLTLDSPTFVLRCLYKARWNAIVGLPPTDGLRPIEEQAYWGWLGLEAAQVDTDVRFEALSHYHRVGGQDAVEAQAVLLARSTLSAQAAALFGREHGRSAHLRYRNHALALAVPR